MKTITTFVLVCSTLLSVPFARADTFGLLSPFEIEFVTIGNPGNSDDTTGNPNPAGKVDYIYRIGKYEISEATIDAANAEAGLGITHSNRGANKPATSISWNEAAKFVNYLNTSSGSTAAYKFDGDGNFQLWQSGDAGYNANNQFRNSLAKYFLPSADEWYKAAYYDPSSDIYYNYPTGSNSVLDGIDFRGDTTFDAVFRDGDYNLNPNDITNVGILGPYGTAGQGGNVYEWEETSVDLSNSSGSSPRGFRGGSWFDNSFYLSVSYRGYINPTFEINYIGFRVASLSTAVPEPNSLVLITCVAVCGLLKRRRCSRVGKSRPK